MKLCTAILISMLWSSVYAQTDFFKRDTVAWKDDSLGQRQYLIGEKWFLTQNSENLDTLNFTRFYYRDESSWKLVFDQDGNCDLEGAMMSCGKWAVAFFVPYTIEDSVLSMDADSSTLFPLFLGQFKITDYSDGTMTWIKK